jgi:hypothetical protein
MPQSITDQILHGLAIVAINKGDVPKAAKEFADRHGYELTYEMAKTQFVGNALKQIEKALDLRFDVTPDRLSASYPEKRFNFSAHAEKYAEQVIEAGFQYVSVKANYFLTI